LNKKQKKKIFLKNTHNILLFKILFFNEILKNLLVYFIYKSIYIYLLFIDNFFIFIFNNIIYNDKKKKKKKIYSIIYQLLYI